MHKEKAAGSVSQSGLVEANISAKNIYQAHDLNSIEIDDPVYAPLSIASRFSLSASLAFEVCRLAGLGVR